MNTALNTKKLAAMNRRARRNLALKLALEHTFKREVRSYFFELRKQAISKFINDGEILNSLEYNGKTIDMLRKQYNGCFQQRHLEF